MKLEKFEDFFDKSCRKIIGKLGLEILKQFSIFRKLLQFWHIVQILKKKSRWNFNKTLIFDKMSKF